MHWIHTQALRTKRGKSSAKPTIALKQPYWKEMLRRLFPMSLLFEDDVGHSLKKILVFNNMSLRYSIFFDRKENCGQPHDEFSLQGRNGHGENQRPRRTGSLISEKPNLRYRSTRLRPDNPLELRSTSGTFAVAH